MTEFCELRTANCELRTANCELRTVGYFFALFKYGRNDGIGKPPDNEDILCPRCLAV